MDLATKVKLLREDKKISQEFVSHQLGLSQSQYSRRENGEVKFVAEEIGKLAKLLEVSVSHIYGEETNSFTVHTQNGGNFGQYIQVSEKLIEQYEARLKEKDEIILLLKKQS
ncbi:helix-turn-helix domain-containing protein [Lacinutrix undariae]